MDKYNAVGMDAVTNCIEDPQFLLSQALAKKNFSDFKNALDRDADPDQFDPVTHISVFEMALKTYGCSKFVDECIRRGCKCDYINSRTNKSPINYAADSKDPNIMASILSVNNIQVNVKYSNLTPLNYLAKNISSDNFNDVFQCMKMLINNGANPNIPDQREYIPIFYIIKNKDLSNEKKREIITYFLKNCELNLDTFRDGEVREKLENQFPDITLPIKIGETSDFESLVSYIRNGFENKFIQSYNKYLLNSSEDNQKNIIQEENLKLLIETIKCGHIQGFKEILKANKCNFNSKQPSMNPLHAACIWGNNEALRELLNLESVAISKTDNLLKTIIEHLDRKKDPYNDFANYNACFNTLLNSDKININEIDSSGTSALFYAVKYKNEEAISELLKRGANIGYKSKFNDIPISGINPEVLENHFDSCITTNGLQSGDDSFEIVIDYKNFIPFDPFNKNQQRANHVKNEMTPIEYISNTKELKHLLKHPLITSILYLKWHRLSLIFYINLILYSIFCVSLVTFIILKFNNTTDEIIVNIFYILSFLGLAYLIIREIFQFLMSPQGFIRSKVNLLEISLIVLTIITLSEPNYHKEIQRVLAVFTILLATLELCLLVGSLPVLSISTHMIMLRVVTETFFKCFALYSMFVITFSISFYILFSKPGNLDSNANENNSTDATTDEEGEFNNFGNPFTAIIKTVVMLTGEFDAGDIQFNSYYSYLVFLLFVFFMSIVLLNLLNGLAVSDTQAIKSQAELNGSICRTIILSGYERALTFKGGDTSFLVNHEPFRSIFKRLLNIFPDLISGSQIYILPNENNRIMINDLSAKSYSSEGALLEKASSIEKDKKKKVIEPPVKFLPCCCSFLTSRCTEMEARTVKTAFNIIYKREKYSKHNNRLEKIEENIAKILQLLQTNRS